MADALDVSLRTYQKYEEGSRNPPLGTLIKMAIILDVTTDWLLGRPEIDYDIYWAHVNPIEEADG